MATYTINFIPHKKNDLCIDNESILDCARKLDIGINNVCGGKGTCNSCRIKVISGRLSQITSGELSAFSAREISHGWRLACQAYPLSDCVIDVPSESLTTLHRLQLEGSDVQVTLDPVVKSFLLKLEAPSLSDQTSDADRLISALKTQYQEQCQFIDFKILQIFSDKLRSWNWECQALLRDKEIVDVTSIHSRILGLAVDLGTTKIAAYLIDLASGQTLVADGVINPQINYGDDVISRITNSIKSVDIQKKLQESVIAILNKLVIELTAKVDNTPDSVIEAVIVGNTAMHHLLLGLPVKQLAMSPFIPVASNSLDIKARELGLKISTASYIHILPNIAGYVGADHVAALLATNCLQKKGVSIIIDIGTNTEISMIKGGKITSVSCASGPAFEGAHIKCGMRAANGAIEHVRIKGDSVRYQTVGNASAIGLCGSGMLDAMAQMYLAGIINNSGRMLETNSRVRKTDEQYEYVLVKQEENKNGSTIIITQNDIRELQLAKAAIRAAIHVLLKQNNCSEEQIDEVIIAGAFGTYIDIFSAITIGLLPALPIERFQQIGNAAGVGAKLALVSKEQRAQSQIIASKIKYIELANSPDFMQAFMQANYIGRYRINNSKREVIE